MPSASLDGTYFERLYAEKRDPWNFETSEYELEKYRATLDALGDARFGSAFEIGCSVGVLTALLAPSCDALLAVDINERALDVARARCAERANVRFARMTFPHDAPAGTFDLVLLSEVAYYWSDDDLRKARDTIAACARGGTLELVHFLPKVADYVRDGDAVHEAFIADRRFSLLDGVRAEKYRIDVLRVA
ncbi:MAG: methyltransferase domain-containing protein [Candidatus Eremiobacteraeota bacterium]|nr:methyltransferase domain-containing protein [Candidatus Eremiobacteraeota bacterium]